jgi:alpha-soluble NSF attachment protein
MSKGDQFKSQAEKHLQQAGSSLSSFFGFGGSQKYDEAAEMFIKAANAYKLENKWNSAADMFLKASTCHQQGDSASDSIKDLVDAGNSLKKVNPLEAIPIFIKAIEKYNENGRFGQSAKLHQEIAETYENEGNFDLALNHFNHAVELYQNDNKPLSAQPCSLKIATLHAKLGECTKAAGIFERIAKESLQSRLGAFSAKGYFFQALLCYQAAGDGVATKSKLNDFKSADHTFSSSRECSFLEKIIQASHHFSLFASNEMFRLWTTTILRNSLKPASISTK